MYSGTYSFARLSVGITSHFEQTHRLCAAYRREGDVDFSVTVSPADIEFEREKSAREHMLEGLPVRQYPDAYLETLAVYRKIADKMIDFDTLLFHGSAIAVDGTGYLFTAKSGTGKSTHTRLWREAFGQRAVMINDDKPLLRITDSTILVCGTPWDGKHRLSTNAQVPLAGICILDRGLENVIAPISAREALPMVLQQTHRPEDPVKLQNLLGLVEKLTQKVPFYHLTCNMNPEAAQVAYGGMRGKERSI